MKQKVLLIGGRSKAKSLALSLINRGYSVTAINNNFEDCSKLSEIDKLTVIKGDGTKPFVLEDAGAYDFNIAIALTNKDEENLVICELCKKRFRILRTVALVSDPKKTEIFYKMGIDKVVCAISAVTAIIEHETFLEKMTNIIPIGEGNIQIAEVNIPPLSPIIGKKLWEINLPASVIIGCILRDDRTMIPGGNNRILEGDKLVLICGDGHELAAIHELTGGHTIEKKIV